MGMKRSLLLFFLACLFAFAAFAQTNPTVSQSSPVAGLTATGLYTDIPNKNQQAVAWRLTFWYTGFSSVTMEIDCAPDNGSGGPGGYITMTGAYDSTTNPVTVASSPFAGTIAAKEYCAHVAVNVGAVTGSGNIYFLLLGYSGTSAAAASGGSGPPTPGGGGAYYTALTGVSGTPTFTVPTAAAGSWSLKLSLTGSVTGSTLDTTNWVTPFGQLMAIEVCQDGTGGRTFVFPTNMLGFSAPDPTANVCTKQVGTFDGTNVRNQTGGVSSNTPTIFGGPQRAAPNAANVPSGATECWLDSTTTAMLGCKDSSNNIQNTISPAASRTANSFVTYIDGAGLQHTATVGNSNLPASALTVARSIDNDSQSATPLLSGQISGRFVVPQAATIVEIDVMGGTGLSTGTLTYTGTSSVQLQKVHGGSATNLLSGSLATASGYACALTTTSPSTCVFNNGMTASASITISATSLVGGDIVQLTSPSADGTQDWFTATVVYTIN